MDSSIGTSTDWPVPVRWLLNRAARVACAAICEQILSQTEALTKAGGPFRPPCIAAMPDIPWMMSSYAGRRA